MGHRGDGIGIHDHQIAPDTRSDLAAVRQAQGVGWRARHPRDPPGQCVAGLDERSLKQRLGAMVATESVQNALVEGRTGREVSPQALSPLTTFGAPMTVVRPSSEARRAAAIVTGYSLTATAAARRRIGIEEIPTAYCRVVDGTTLAATKTISSSMLMLTVTPPPREETMPGYAVEYDEETDRYHLTFSWEDDEVVTEAVVYAIAAVTDVDPTDLPPLAANIDTDALNRILRPTGDRDAGDAHVSFEYYGYEITVYSYGRITFTEL